MTARLLGPLSFNRRDDEKGHRTYTVTNLVEVDPGDGPQIAGDCPDLPRPGEIWNYGNDFDVWATCKPDKAITIHQEQQGDHPTVFRVEQRFSTKGSDRCQDNPVGDPCLEPPGISGSFVQYERQPIRDRHGNILLTSSKELLQVIETRANATVRIEQNVYDLQLPLLTYMLNIAPLNAHYLWGMKPRHVKLASASWSHKLSGSCNSYYNRVLDFEVSFEGHDQEYVDKGTRVLDGKWTWNSTTEQYDWTLKKIGGKKPRAAVPSSYIKPFDVQGRPLEEVTLDGKGGPLLTDNFEDLVTITPEIGGESNMFLLGIPAYL